MKYEYQVPKIRGKKKEYIALFKGLGFRTS
jgi:hypothetical protein